jgi:nitrate reductase gamma subunit
MRRNIQIGILSLLAILFATLLLIDVAWFFHGSLELFPTDEQQGKIKSMAVLSGCGFTLVEAAVLFLLRRLFRNRRRPCSDMPPSLIDGNHP